MLVKRATGRETMQLQIWGTVIINVYFAGTCEYMILINGWKMIPMTPQEYILLSYVVLTADWYFPSQSPPF